MAQGVESPVGRRRQAAASLRQLRGEARRTVDEVADFLDCPPDRVRRMEAGKATPRVAEARCLLDLYEVVGTPREELLNLVRETRRRTWWHRYDDLLGDDLETLLLLEEEAVAIATHQPSLVPGLLQTERYASELMATLSDQPLDALDRRLQLRMARQQVLAGADAPRLTVILDEAALRRPVGGPDVMRGQYTRLVEAADTANITVRVLRFHAGPYQAMGFGFHIFEFAPGDPKVVQIELLDREQFIEDAEDVARYLAAFEQAVSRTLDPTRSRAFLVGLLEC
jgi:Domain of unknown function (DUF5753)/Helix-turn-helix domain